MENKHILPIPPETLAQIQLKIDEANALMAPYALPLTPQERLELPKMGDKTLSFVEKALELIHHYPLFAPSYLNVTAFDTDMADATGLRVIHTTAHQLADNVADTIMVAGSEAYQTALLFYNSVKTAAAQDVPGAKEIYEELRARFPSRKHKTVNQ